MPLHRAAMNNMLYNPATRRVSALLDFDWAAVAHPAHEFFSGLHDLQGSTHPANPALQSAVLTGAFEPSNSTNNITATTARPDASDANEHAKAWALARSWDASLLRASGLRPSSLAGITTLESLRALEDLIAPFALCNTVMVGRAPAEKLHAARADTEAKLDALLDSLTLQAGL